MAESFGTAFTLVEVMADDGSEGRPTTEFWVAAAKPSQALTLVLAAVSEGWTAELVIDRLTQQQQASLEKLNLKPGEVCKVTKQGRGLV
jgi:hypothetical protein